MINRVSPTTRPTANVAGRLRCFSKGQNALRRVHGILEPPIHFAKPDAMFFPEDKARIGPDITVGPWSAGSNLNVFPKAIVIDSSVRREPGRSRVLAA